MIKRLPEATNYLLKGNPTSAKLVLILIIIKIIAPKMGELSLEPWLQETRESNHRNKIITIVKILKVILGNT